jgi:Fe-S-cluster containining protein
MIKLKMGDDEKGRCPFLGAGGCTVYEDRPGACRIYPLGRAATKRGGKPDAMEKFFIVKEEHCLGFGEDREWTVEEWIKNEGLDEYNVMNDQWLEVTTSSKGLGHEKDVPRKTQMFYMASYNLDRLREFIFKSRFFDRFEVPPGLKEKLASDDAALLKFAFDWLKFSLFGENTIQIKKNQSF